MEITTERRGLNRIMYMLSEMEVKEALVSGVRQVHGLAIPPGGAWTFVWYRNESGRLCVEMTQTSDEVQVAEGGGTQ